MRINWAASMQTWRVYDDEGAVLRDDLLAVKIEVPCRLETMTDGGCVQVNGMLIINDRGEGLIVPETNAVLPNVGYDAGVTR